MRPKQCRIDDPRTADNYKLNREPGRRRRIGYICPLHGYIRGSHCPDCADTNFGTLSINTGEWVKGWYEHIDTDPIYIESKDHLLSECAKRDLMPRAFIKHKSSAGKGLELKRR